MKKTQFFKKKLENFLKNSMHRNSSGSVKKPSGAQKKPGLEANSCQSYTTKSNRSIFLLPTAVLIESPSETPSSSGQQES